MPWIEVIRRLLKRPLVMACLAVILVFALVALTARLWVPNEDLAARTSESALDEITGLERSYHPPGWLLYLDADHGHWANTGVDPATREERPAVAPENRNWGFFDVRTWHLPLGCDIHGVSLLAKLIRGTELAFIIGIIPTLISSVIAVIMGLLAGYFGKWIDDAIGYLINTLASIPFVLLLIAFIQAVRDSDSIARLFEAVGQDSKPLRNLVLVLIVIGLTSWIGLCRLVRAEVLKHKDRDYVHAARALGCGHMRIIGKHILPNVMHLVIIVFTLSFVGSVGLEVFLSFVGIGIDSTLPTWGQVIVKGRDELQRDPSVWWPLTFATATLFTLSLAFSLFGDALRDALDPKLRT
ncbi:MAG: ABC transporter permease [Planctomycetes bacterium]|jgi:ABC-type dipeptide/oligopeptide/nickel transport system permease subunit|nr:ABC transporter permease [Planctomycetota bacterium]MCL4729597.1 ABC transporter permease [Planctomycetota bacterium]